MGNILKENPLIEKINTLKARFEDGDSTDKWVIGEWESQAKEAIIRNSLVDHEGVQMIIKHIREEVREINDVLLNAKSSELNDADRDRFLDMKKFYKWFLTFFSEASDKIAELNENVDNELTNK